MDSIIKEGTICVKENNIEFHICKLEHTLYEDESFKFVFTPNYSVISLLKNFEGIPGLDLDLKKDEYIRKNINPVFIFERVPSKNRENLYEELEEVGLDYIDPIEYLIRTDKKYSGDDLYVVRYKEKELINVDEIITKNNMQSIIKIILDNLAKGNDVLYNEILINDDNRFQTFEILSGLYNKSLEAVKEKQQKGIDNAKKEHRYQGRKPIKVDTLIALETFDKVDKKQITVSNALDTLGISKAKYYRLRKSFKNKMIPY